MKNVYLYIMFLLIGFSSFGQDLQNANWLFGHNAWLKFSPSPVAMSGSAMDVWEGCASVSDQNGNLLFYTNGRTVWKNNHTTMTNGNNSLTSSISNSQGVIILPKPANPNKYYIVYIDGYTGGRKGLRYAEVDVNLGSVTSLNTVLKDHLGNNIDITYNSNIGSESEKLTSTIHSNGIDYWVITQIKNYIYSYKVTSSGIGNSFMPDSYTSTTVSLTDGGGGNSAGPGCMKISPNGEKIAICYEGRVSSSNPQGGILLGRFNATTGLVTVDNLVSTSKRPYGIEFSPNSEYVYFSTSVTDTDAYDPELFKMSGIAYTLIQSVNRAGGSLQRAANGKIYFSEFEGGYLSVINNPNNFSNPDFHEDESTLYLGGSNKMYGGLPQWTYWQRDCPANLVLTSTINDVLAPAQDNRQAEISITASNIVNNGAIGIYHAGDDVVFKHGFHSANGSVFRGYIEGCSGEFEGLRAPAEEESMRTTETDEEKELFTLYPNPATENVTITSGKTMQNITVTSLDGFTLFQGEVRANSYELNVSSYRKGIYVITVTTEGGEMEIKKLMKE
jgi:hypothetical protein